MNEEDMLKVLSLAVDEQVPDHRLKYLLMKLYGKDGLSLDVIRTDIFDRIQQISKEIKEE